MREPEDQAAATEKTPQKSGKAKRPYQKPSFRHDPVFETTALICGKMSSTESQCRFTQKLS